MAQAPVAPAKPAKPGGAGPAAPAPVAKAVLIRLSEEVDAAFAAQDFVTAAAKIEELLAKMGPGTGAPASELELLQFNLGLAYLKAERAEDAEKAFTQCLTKYPKGEYLSRCYLGVGLACVAQGKTKNERAVSALRRAKEDRALRSEACLALGQVLAKMGKRAEALVELRSLMGADVRTPDQTTAAIGVVGLLADNANMDDLVIYLDRLLNQAGVRDAMAWYTNQVIVRADEAVGMKDYETALAIYQSVPPRNEIIEVQSLALQAQRKTLKSLEAKAAEKALPSEARGKAGALANRLKVAIENTAKNLEVIEKKTDLDANVLMRRGRCLYHLQRYEEALVCFRTLRAKYKTSTDAQSAASAEIIIYSELKRYTELQPLCVAYLAAYPDAENAEQIASLAGELLVQDGKWNEVGKFYKELETRFPKSEDMDRFVFYQAASFFYAAEFDKSTPLLERFFKTFPKSDLYETGMYYEAMTNFFSNKYKETLSSCQKYLAKFPSGRYAGDMQYRLSFIDFNDKEDQTDKIIRELGAFIAAHPEDLAVGPMRCLLADTYKKKANDADALAAYKKDHGEEATALYIKANTEAALASYKNAVWSASLDDVTQYALDTATQMLQDQKKWSEIADLHSEFLKKFPASPLAMISATWVARMKTREGKPDEAAAILADGLRSGITNPASEQVEFLIDELVKVTVPRNKKIKDVDLDATDKQLVDVLTKIGADKNPTANARLYYARARLAQMLKRKDRSDLYMRGIAKSASAAPEILSPALLAVCGEILLKDGSLDQAEAMFRRLTDRYKTSAFSDAGPGGLGYVALAKKQPEEALRIFEEVIEKNPGSSNYRENTLGKLEALIGVGRFDDANKLALETIGDKAFKGELSGRAYLLQASMFREQAGKTAGAEATELLAKAHAVYQRVYVTYVSIPEVCADAYWGAYEVLKAMARHTDSRETLAVLRDHPKLQNTTACKRAREIPKGPISQ